jgi:hypothetical protein
MKIFLYLIILLPFILSSSCRKEKIETIYLDQGLKDYCYFKTGSFWIYNDSLYPGIGDTITVISDRIYYLDPSIGNNGAHSRKKTFIVEEFEYNINSTFDLKVTSIGGSATCMHEPRVNNFCYIVTYSENNGNSAYYFFWYPIVGSTASQYLNESTLTHVYDSLQVGTRKFCNVVEMTEEFSDPPAKTIKRYFARNYGLVKKIQYSSDTTVWNLVQENIIQ